MVTGHFAPAHGGVARFTGDLLACLPADCVAVLAPDASGALEVDAASLHTVRRYAGHASTNPLMLRTLARAIEEHQPEALWVTSGIPLGAVAVLAKRVGVRRVVVTTHGLEAGWSRIPVLPRVVRAVSAYADVVTVLGETTGELIRPLLAAGVDVQTLHGGVDVERFRPQAETASVIARHDLKDRPVVISVARLVARKGHDALVRSWPAVCDRHPDAVALIVGEGPERRRLERLAHRLGVERNMIFTGAVDDDDLPSYYAAAHVYALPCRTKLAGMWLEGLGLTTLEASASGLPVVVGRSGGAADALIDGVTGYAFDTDRPDGGAGELADRLIRLLDRPGEMIQMGQAGREWVEQEWRSEQMAARLAAILAG